MCWIEFLYTMIFLLDDEISNALRKNVYHINAFSGTINLSYGKPLKYKDMLTFYKTIRKGERKTLNRATTIPA